MNKTQRQIYITTTNNLAKKCIYKVGYANDAQRRQSELTGYAADKDNIFVPVYVIDVPDSFMPGKVAVDKAFHDWLKVVQDIHTMSSDELNEVLGTSYDRTETELYRGISADELYAYALEFYHSESASTALVDWSRHAKTPFSIAQSVVDKLDFYTLLKKRDYTICDIACKDASIVKALVSKLYNIKNLKTMLDATKSVVDILSHIHAYCLAEEYKTIKSRVADYACQFKNVDRDELMNSCAFDNFHVFYTEDERMKGLMLQLNNIKNMKRFDAVVINPPYATTGFQTLHLDFTEAALQMSDKVVSLFPFNLVYQKTKKYQSYKDAFSKRLVSVEEVSSDVFEDTDMSNVGIWDFGKENDGEIKIKAHSSEQTVASLSEVTNLVKIEKEMLAFLSNKDSKPLFRIGQNNYKKHLYHWESYNCSEDELKVLTIKNSLKEIKSVMSSDDVYCLIVNRGNSYKGKAFTSKNDKIFNCYEDVETFCLECNTSTGYHALLFKGKKSVEQCKKALGSSLMRFALYKASEFCKGTLTKDCYRYVVDIDWSKVDNDVDILVQCGCSEDKAKQFVEYAEKFIWNVDNLKK